MSELHTPKHYTRSLYVLQSVDTSFYLFTAIFIYYFTGRDVQSPALGSTGPLVRKIAYGVAIPTIVIAGVINGHVAAKFIMVRAFRHSDRMHSKCATDWCIWIGIVAGLWSVAWVIAEAIPNFNNLLGFISALFGKLGPQ